MICHLDAVRFKDRITVSFPPHDNDVDQVCVHAGAKGVVVAVRNRPGLARSREALVSIIGSPVDIVAWFGVEYLERIGEKPE